MNTESKLAALQTPELQEILEYLRRWDVTELHEQDVLDLAWEYGISETPAEQYLLDAYVSKRTQS